MARKDEEVHNFKTGERFYAGDHSIEEDWEYPHHWFELNPGKKPTIHIPYKELDLDQALSSLLNRGVKQISPPLIKSILHYYASRIEEKLEEDWESDKIKIGVKGDTVTPSSLYTAIIGAETWEGYQGSNSEDPVYMIGSLLLIYRIIRVPSSPIMSDVLDGINDRFKNVFSRGPFYGLISVRETLAGLDNDINFRKLIACYDFFFSKFPKNPMSKLKIGTLPSRWRDFTAFKNMFETYRLLGLSSIVEYSSWIWEPAIQRDLERLLKHPFAKKYSNHGYFFYSSDLGFINKSIYSVTMNPAIHVFNQVIYCSFGNQRGINAHMVHPPNAPLVVRNALYVAFALRTGSEWDLVFGSLQQKKEKELLSLSSPVHPSDDDYEKIPIPQTRDPIGWFSYWKAIETDYPPEYLAFLKTVHFLCKDSRPNSVGQYLYSYLSGL